MQIAALVSGGVDSSVVVHRLKESGYTPHIFYIQIGMKDREGFLDCPSEEDIEIVSYIAKKYACKFDIVPLEDEYWDTVVAYTLDTVKRGLTPNPDIMCNRMIKFGAFEQKYGKDFDKIASGHYATTSFANGRYFLSTSKDTIKDQTYFLGQITYAQLSKLMFPIGDLNKAELREIALKAGLPSASRKDSQGICFLGKINYNDFIRNYLGEKPGKIVEKETGRVLGTHRGFWFHTIGQRKGLGLSGGPWYVVEKEIESNTIFVSCGYDTALQYGTEFRLGGVRLISDAGGLGAAGGLNAVAGCDGKFSGACDLDASGELPVGTYIPERIWFKIRHTPEFTSGSIRLETEGDNTIAHIVSDKPIQGIASGQFGVIYVDSPYKTQPEVGSAKICLASGVIL